MIFSGPNSGAAWGIAQVLDSYEKLCELANANEVIDPFSKAYAVEIMNQTAAHMPNIDDGTVDLICMDPPYYNNVQYAELSDYFYVWQKRTLKDIFPEIFDRRMTNKTDEAVANPYRDGGAAQGQKQYEGLMGEIFLECGRVLKSNGIMTIMFNHKDQEAWEALTRALIENNWIIMSSFPVESESSVDIHHKEMAATQSSIFLACRKREADDRSASVWSGFGGTGVQHEVREGVREGLREFESLNLTPVDEMVASYGRALRVLSQNWPVLDGDEPVSPIQAMNEASRVVAEHQIRRITGGRLQVEDLNPEAAMALTLFGIYGLADLPYDDGLNLSRSLRIGLENHNAGYQVQGRMIGINPETRGAKDRRVADEGGYFAPLVRSGSKLRLAMPGERHVRRLSNPQTEWDLLHGLIMAYREGDIPVARAYMQQHAVGAETVVLNLLKVWTTEMGEEALRKEGRAIAFGLAD